VGQEVRGTGTEAPEGCSADHLSALRQPRIREVRDTIRKEGISGGKATGAVLTGGLSILATGLSRKQAWKSLTCSNCKMHWFVASV
jgi:hypothetical protein